LGPFFSENNDARRDGSVSVIIRPTYSAETNKNVTYFLRRTDAKYDDDVTNVMPFLKSYIISLTDHQ